MIRPINTFVMTSRRGTRLNCWKIIAQWDRHSRSARPFRALTSTAFSPSPNKILPEVASPKRLIVRNRVDLPAPERPMMPIIWPSGMSIETLSTAFRSPNVLVNAVIFSTKNYPPPFSPGLYIALLTLGVVWTDNSRVLSGSTIPGHLQTISAEYLVHVNVRPFFPSRWLQLIFLGTTSLSLWSSAAPTSADNNERSNPLGE